MNPLSLKYFLAVVEAQSITRAAERLYVSQQNISNHIARLEQEYNVVLFNRKPAFHLTYAGEQVYKTAQKILNLDQQLHQQLQDLSGDNGGCITIGVTPTRAPSMLAQLLPLYHQQYPGVEIRPIVDVTDSLIEKLENGELDLFLGFDSSGFRRHIKTIPLELERLCVVVPYSYLKRKYPDSLPAVINLFNSHVILSEFSDVDFLLPVKGSRVREASDQCMRSQNFSPKILLECSNMPTLIALAAANMGVAFAFESMARRQLGENLGKENGAFLFPAMSDQVEGTVVIGYNEEHYLSLAAQNFIRLTADLYKKPMF